MWIWITLVVVFHVLGFVSSIHAVMGTRTPQGAVAWAVALNAFPYLAVPAYWVFGRSRFQGYVTARQEGEHEIRQVLLKAREETLHLRSSRSQAVPALAALGGVTCAALVDRWIPARPSGAWIGAAGMAILVIAPPAIAHREILMLTYNQFTRAKKRRRGLRPTESSPPSDPWTSGRRGRPPFSSERCHRP